MSYRFKDARVQSGISQKDAAEQLQVSAATVNNWESGRRLPTIDALEKMADLYGVSTDYLLGRTDSSNPVPPYCGIHRKGYSSISSRPSCLRK